MIDQIPALRLEGIVKTFPGVRALDGVSFAVMPGEVHALMGENGAGKSTLMKLMGGLVEPDTGTRAVPQGLSVGYMEQDPDFTGFATLTDLTRDASQLTG